LAAASDPYSYPLDPSTLDAILSYNDALETEALSSPPSSSSAPSFPEDSALLRLQSNKTSSAVAFSGGGSRSYVASAGYVQAFRDLGLWSKVKYAAGISGGNWFLNSYSYRSPVYDTTSYLGAILPPEENTMDQLKKMDTICMRGNAGRHFTLDMVEALLEGKDPAEDWIEGVYVPSPLPPTPPPTPRLP
jgi:hypothetical protein